MADARYNRLNNQAPAQSQLEVEDRNDVGRSVFDFSHIHNGNTLLGLLAPVLTMEVVPNEDIDIDLAALIELRNPTTRNLLNNCRVYFHGYINYLVDLWEGAKNFLDAGRSGNISLQRPSLVWHVTKTSPDTTVNACTPMSLLNFFGLPAEVMQSSDWGTSKVRPPLRVFQAAHNDDGSHPDYSYTVLSAVADYFPADCAMAYQRNWRDYYSNQNLLQNNKLWFPDNEDHFILSYACEDVVCINYEHEYMDGPASRYENILGSVSDSAYPFGVTPEPNNPSTVIVSDISSNPRYWPNLAGIKFRQFKGDRFTASLPFPDLIRGDIPAIGPVADGDIDYLQDGAIYAMNDDGTLDVTRRFGLTDNAELYPVNTPSTDAVEYISAQGDRRFAYSFGSDFDDEQELRVKLPSAITMNDIRALETMTVFKERMARTNGEYNDMIEAQFGYNPHHHVRKGEYIGGFYQDFVFSSVMQTSESATTPLGTKAGQGISSGQGSIGHIHTRDFGWIQVYMSIVPDVYYTQGIPRQFSKKTQLEMYFPIFNNLEPQAIFNKELFVSGTESVDNDVFAYEDRYAEFKSAQNRVSGLMALSPTVASFDASRVMARRFTSTPALNSLFVSLVPENTDMSVFAVSDEPPFDFSVGFKIRRVSPMPYTAVPGSLSSKMHA